MKSFVLTIAMTALVATTISTPAFGAETKTKQSIFLTEKACNAALASKDFAIYVPVDVSKKNVDPIDDKNVFGVKLEADQCRLQVTMHGEKWVIQAGGTLMRARKDASGEFVIFARNDCGNEDKTPPAPEPLTSPSTTPIETTPPASATEEPKMNVATPPGWGSVQIENNIHLDGAKLLPPPLPPPTDKYHGWCKFWTDAGCTVVAVVVVGGTIYIATQGGDDDKGKGPGGEIGPAFLKATITPRVGFIPPRNGRGGGFIIGASLSM